MPDFEVKITVTVTNVPTEADAIAVVQKMIQRGGVSKGKISFVPVPRDAPDVVESGPR